MKFAVDTAHRDFFKNKLRIEFEGFFTSEEVNSLHREVKNSLEARLSEKGLPLEKASNEQLYMAGRDLWRTNAALRKIVIQSKLADIAADLTEERGVRFGYDQYLPLPPPYFEKLPLDHPYIRLLKLKEGTLETVSCIEGLLCGVLIPLKEGAGKVVYITPSAPLDLPLLQESLLIVYARGRAIYILQENDPHTHALKHLGIGFGELLSDKLNPMLKR